MRRNKYRKMEQKKEKKPYATRASVVNEVIENLECISPVADVKIKTDISMESKNSADITDDSGFETESRKNNTENSSEMDMPHLQNKLANDSGIENDDTNSNDTPLDVNQVNELVENVDSATEKEDMIMNDSTMDTDSAKNLVENSSEVCNSDSEKARYNTIVDRDVECIDDKSTNIMNEENTTDNILNPITEPLDKIECLSCMTVVSTDNGIILKDCLHKFCKECLLNNVQNTTDSVVKCPLMVDNTKCNGIIQPQELTEINNLENACGIENKNVNTSNEEQVFNCIIINNANITQITDINPKKLNMEQIPLEIWSPAEIKPKKKKAVASTSKGHTSMSSLMDELVYLDDVPLIENMDIFDCPVCSEVIPLGQGVMLRDCLHFLCKECLKKLVQSTDEALIRCPHLDDAYQRCVGVIQDREIRAVVAKNIYEKYLEKSIRIAESSMGDSYHCKTPNCIGWCVYQPDSKVFECPICRVENCIVCRVIHTNLTCDAYQQKQACKEETDATEKVIKTQLKKREIMHCPKCQALIEKTAGGGGCDAIKCTMCLTEVCWATRGPRWGPNGKGDISAGCRCKIDGQRCHPSCLGCH